MHSGSLEHICVKPDGPVCYCGNRGCLETFCSASALELRSGLSVKEFFLKLRNPDNSVERLQDIWQDYLRHLAFAIRNLNLLIDCPVILSGYLAPYFLPEDLDRLLGLINEHTPFPLAKDSLLTGTHGQYTPAIGAALFYVKNFLDT